MGLAIAESLKIDLEEFKRDIEVIFNWLSTEQDLSFEQKIFHVNSQRNITISDCSMTVVPPQIHYLKNLQIFQLQFTQVFTIPSEIGILTQLQRLSLDNNQLVSIPVEIGYLFHLSKVDCRNNRLRFIPIELGYCRNINTLNVASN
ncbi:hypothetical protein QNI19_30415 [Cytophagaceae bacterium DM2B3-1]|uniref:Leucine-rich repeat domain-containing protein n=1 Tax=Xanthocytophaga flava TaxID=3048013 RepID=A0ABT7CUE3_9BACT|nr:hypothetical protein [Xanthocytophaga flavus]MDJ1469163.1 hypothetical protein [Xanthocytophaga flavus]MDJ1497291.1 hypothetical protein [Xanthocytophaga flavus]